VPSITPDIANALVHASALRSHSSTTSQNGDAPTFSALLDANMGNGTAATNAGNAATSGDGNAEPSGKDRADTSSGSPLRTGQNAGADSATGLAKQPDSASSGKQADNTTGEAGATTKGAGDASRGPKWLRALTKAGTAGSQPPAGTADRTSNAQRANDPSASDTDPNGSKGGADSASGTVGDAGTSGSQSQAQPGAPGTQDALSSDVTDLAAVLGVVLDGGTKSADNDTKMPPATDDGDQDDDSGTPAKSDAAAGNGQPVAAVLSLGNAASAASAATDANGSAVTMGAAAKMHVRAALMAFGGPDQPAPPEAKDAVNNAAKTATAAKEGTSTNAPADSDGAQSSSNDFSALMQMSGAPQGFSRADNDAIGMVSAATGTGGEADGGTSRSDTVTSAAATGNAASGPAGAARPDGSVLPNFGISNANLTAPAATPSADKTATPAVPIAGLAVAISARARAGANQFDIRLDPPELGRIDVRLDVDRSTGQVSSHVTVERADTLQLLQSQQPQLERALEQAGLKTADNGLQFTLRDQSFSGQNGNGGGGAQPQTAQLVIPDADLPPVQTTQIYSRFGRPSGIDIRV